MRILRRARVLGGTIREAGIVLWRVGARYVTAARSNSSMSSFFICIQGNRISKHLQQSVEEFVVPSCAFEFSSQRAF